MAAVVVLVTNVVVCEGVRVKVSVIFVKFQPINFLDRC